MGGVKLPGRKKKRKKAKKKAKKERKKRESKELLSPILWPTPPEKLKSADKSE